MASGLTEALEIALSEPLGPVHLDLPEDVALAPATEAVPASTEGRPWARPRPPSARSRNLGCRSPARGGPRLVGHAPTESPLLRSVIDRHRLPFASTTMAKGMIAEDHPLSLGCIERARRQVQRELLRSADLVVGLGYDVVEVEYEAWIGQVPLLSIDVDPVDADPSVTIAHEVIGDLDASLEWLAQLPPGRPEWPADMAARHRDRFQRSLRPSAGFAPIMRSTWFERCSLATASWPSTSAPTPIRSRPSGRLMSPARS